MKIEVEELRNLEIYVAYTLIKFLDVFVSLYHKKCVFAFFSPSYSRSPKYCMRENICIYKRLFTENRSRISDSSLHYI